MVSGSWDASASPHDLTDSEHHNCADLPILLHSSGEWCPMSTLLDVISLDQEPASEVHLLSSAIQRRRAKPDYLNQNGFVQRACVRFLFSSINPSMSTPCHWTGRRLLSGANNGRSDGSCHGCIWKCWWSSSQAPLLHRAWTDSMSTRCCCCKFCSKQPWSLSGASSHAAVFCSVLPIMRHVLSRCHVL